MATSYRLKSPGLGLIVSQLLLVLAAASLAVAVTSVGLLTSNDSLFVAGGCLASAAVVATLTPGQGDFPIAATRLASQAFIATALMGLAVWPMVESRAAVSATINAGPEQLQRAALLLCLCGVSFAFGSSLARLLSRSANRPGLPTARIELTTARSGLSGQYSVIFAMAIWGILLFGKQGSLIQAPSYLASDGPMFAVSIGNSLTLPALFALGVAYSRLPKGRRRLVLLCVFIWALTLVSLATRQAALAPLVFVLGRHIGSESAIAVGRKPLIVGGILTTILYQMALTLRRGTSDGFGFLPFGSAVLREPSTYLVPDVAALAGNLAFSLPLTSFTESYGYVPPQHLAVSLSPLPGSMAGWSDIAYSLRVNIFTPYNAIGELATHGYFVVIMYFIAAGALFFMVADGSSRVPFRWKSLVQLAVAGLLLLFVADALQYNLRSTTRVLYYALGIGIGAVFLKRGGNRTASV